MHMKQQGFIVCVVFAVHALSSNAAVALEFQPGVGVGLEFTDNAKLTPDNTADDLIAVTYVAANVSENRGPLTYQASTSLSKQNYTKDSFADQRYFYLNAIADWVMIKNRFTWTVSDNFSQVPVNALGSNTPNNLQDTNAFKLSADIKPRILARHDLSIVPSFAQYYYEELNTDNKQYSLAANWQYQATRLTDLGLSLSARKIDYTEADPDSGRSIEDVRFLNASIAFNGQRIRSNFDAKLGITDVKRDNGLKTSGFVGHLNWLANLSTRSQFLALISTDLTDTSTAGVRATTDSGTTGAAGESAAADSGTTSTAGGSAALDSETRSGDDVQITTDVIRNSIIDLAYLRKDASLGTRISVRYHKVAYSDNPLDRIIRDFGLQFSYPVTQLLTSSAYINHNRSKQLDSGRLDKTFTVGGNLKYSFSRKIHGVFDLKYRKKDSTVAEQNYNEFSVYVSLVYGFGDVVRPTRAGVF